MIAVQAGLVLLFSVMQGTPPADLSPAIRLYEAGEYRKAADALSPGSAAGHADASLWLGKSLLKLRQWDEAIRAFEQVVKLRPGDAAGHLWLGRAYGEKASHSSAFSAFGLARKVVREFETAVKLDPGSIDARFDLLEFYVEAPGIVGGGKDKAQAQARAIAALNPRIGYTARARILESEKKYDAARAELAKATAEFPSDGGAFLDLAQFLIRRRDYAAAEGSAAAVAEREPSNANALLALAACRVELRKNIPAAEAALRKLSGGPAGDGGPAFEEIYFRLGQALLAQSKPDESRRAFESALRFNPEHAGAKAALASLR